MMRQLARRRLARAASTARTLLFVCKGNICRSPFAERYARLVLPRDVRVSSSGYYPRAGRLPPAEAIGAAQPLGVDLASHRSTVLTADAIAAADLVFVFDDENLETVRRQHPSARKRVFRISLLVDEALWTISDPYGKDVRTFEVVYTQIARLVDSLSALLRPARRPSSPARASEQIADRHGERAGDGKVRL